MHITSDELIENPTVDDVHGQECRQSLLPGLGMIGDQQLEPLLVLQTRRYVVYRL